MGWLFTASKQATPSTTSPLTITHSGVIGRLYVVFATRNTATDAYTGVTDSGGNTWTRLNFAPSSGSVGRRIEQWYCVPTSTFTSITLAFTGTGQAQASMYEITGQAASFLDTNNADFRASSTAPTAVTTTPSEANTLVIAAVQANSNTAAQCTPSAGWTSLGTASAGPAVVYQANPASGVALGVSWTFVTAAGSGHSIGAYKMAPAVAPTATVWDGATEVPVVSVAVWDGATEVPASLDSVA